jgi:T-complex protein 1 subunit beta
MLRAAGLDSADLISQLRASHAHDAASRQGVDVLSGGMGDMNKLGIFESFKVRGLAVFN